MGAQPDWLITTELAPGRDGFQKGRVKVTNVRTGQTICKFGEPGAGEGQFTGLQGVAVSPDSSLVIVADSGNDRIQVLRLLIAADEQSAQLEFVRFIGNGRGKAEGQLGHPTDVALLADAAGQQSVLIVEPVNHRVSQFSLDGTFIRIFQEDAGTRWRPTSITVLETSSPSEVAVAEFDKCCVQIFDHDGNYLREFGTEGFVDGQLKYPNSIASDACGNILVTDFSSERLQIFNSKGEYVLGRSDLGLESHTNKSVAWGSEPAGSGMCVGGC